MIPAQFRLIFWQDPGITVIARSKSSTHRNYKSAPDAFAPGALGYAMELRCAGDKELYVVGIAHASVEYLYVPAVV